MTISLPRWIWLMIEEGCWGVYFLPKLAVVASYARVRFRLIEYMPKPHSFMREDYLLLHVDSLAAVSYSSFFATDNLHVEGASGEHALE